MFRRNFVGGCLALLGLSQISRADWDATSPQQEPSHFFDWTRDEPYTTDPRYAHRLWRNGSNQQVLCNGVDMIPQMVTRCVTGLDGWVELLYHRRVYGKVEYVGETKGG